MANNFFDLVPDNFFTPFNSIYKRYHYDLLQLINNKMTLDNLQVVREDIVEWIVDYLEYSPIELFNEETNETEKDYRALAGAKIRYFVNCGWLIEDFEGLTITYQMDENAIKLLSAMENIVKDDTKTLEFSGYVYNIYNNLYNYHHNHAVDIIEQIYAASTQLKSMLRGLNVNIKKYLTKLISENEARPKEILETIFFEYQKKVVLKAFKNFREKDNPSKYKLFIEKKINELMNDKNLPKMINNYLEVKHDGINSPEYYQEGKDFFTSRLIPIKDQFEEIEDYIQMLDSKNTKYIVTAKRRLTFLLNEETDIEGRIIDCLKGLQNVDDEYCENNSFNIYSTGILDEYSLYKPIVRRKRTTIDELLINREEDKELLSKKFTELFKDSEYSVNEINKFVLAHLDKQKQIHLRDIPIDNFQVLLKVFLVQVYSQNAEVDYKIRPQDTKYEAIGYVLNDCLVERKK